MKLVVLGKESIDQLKIWATELFSNVSNNNVAQPVFNGHPLTPNHLGKLIEIRPVKELRRLEYTFALPPSLPHYRVKPSRYIAHLIGHEGRGSLLSLLKLKGWAISLSAYNSHFSPSFDLFKVSIDVTVAGMQNYTEISTLLFSFIKLLSDSEPIEWIYNDCKSLAEFSFRFQEKQHQPSGYCSKLASSMQIFPIEHAICGESLLYYFLI